VDPREAGNGTEPRDVHIATPGSTFYREYDVADADDGSNAAHNTVWHLGCWMHARRYFVDAVPKDSRAVEALAFIRTLYAVEKELWTEREGERFTHDDVVSWRRSPTGSKSGTARRRRRVCSGRL